ncbi:HlyD family secretion protein [Legionella cherrii]|uniref:Multidrug efflux system n=1 Tax=Legionella cherrii TaxID=28084 RepID=A0A0W0SG75_9GAMM|nr:HlyD family secretion protein [Legionella cherrii]KTC82171.1 multidrug efflux system [Legionella cherrii]VEB33087.1 multidrug efflux system [Legionella cherrii]
MHKEQKEATPITKNIPFSKRFIFLIIIPTVFVLIGIIIYLLGGRYVATDNAYVKADMIPLSPQVSGVVQEVFVIENQNVTKDQLLYRIDPEPFKVALTKAESKLAQVRIDILAMKANYREKQAELELARTKYNFSLRNKKRQMDLAEKHFASLSSLDEANEGAELAAQQIVTSEHNLQSLAASLAGSIDEPVESHPSYLMAKAEYEQAKLDLLRTEIKAPVAGTISAPPKNGQFVSKGSISMTLVANEHPWIEANFTEKELTYVRPGQKVITTIDIYPGKKWKGTVQSLSPATGSEFSIIPAQNATGNWVKIAQRIAVRIQLQPDPNSPPLRSGLSSWVEIDTGHKRYSFKNPPLPKVGEG